MASGLSTDRALKVKGDALVRLRDVFSTTRTCHVTHGYHLKMMQERVYGTLPKGAPSWLTNYLQGYAHALWDELYRLHLEFCFRDSDGTLYSTHKQSHHRLTSEVIDRGEAQLLNNMVGDHYWKGTSKVWSTSLLSHDEYIRSITKEA